MVLFVTIFHFLINISSIFLTFRTLHRLYCKVLCHIKASLFISFLKGNNILDVLNFVYIISCLTSLKIRKKYHFEYSRNSLVIN